MKLNNNMAVMRELCIVPVITAVITNRVIHGKFGMATDQWSSISECLWNP